MNIKEFLGASDEQVRRILVDIRVDDLFNQLVTDKDLYESRTGPLRFRPSVIGSASSKSGLFDIGCPRMMWFQFLGYPGTPIIGEDRKRLDVGTMTHHLVQDMLERGMAKGKVNVEIEKEFWLQITDDLLSQSHGYIDTVLYIGDQKVVVEYKTVSNSAFEKLTAPKDHNLTQVHLYMKAEDTPFAVISYVTIYPNMTWSMLSFNTLWNQSRWRTIVNHVGEVIEHLNEGTIPPPGNNAFFCQHWCGYREYCEEVANESEGVRDHPGRRGGRGTGTGNLVGKRGLTPTAASKLRRVARGSGGSSR